jgi:hypothetical protein
MNNNFAEESDNTEAAEVSQINRSRFHDERGLNQISQFSQFFEHTCMYREERLN